MHLDISVLFQSRGNIVKGVSAAAGKKIYSKSLFLWKFMLVLGSSLMEPVSFVNALSWYIQTKSTCNY